MSARLLGLISVVPAMDKDGYRTYKVKFKVETTDTNMVLAATAAMVCPGLPAYGDPWPADSWAYCRYDTAVQALSGYKDEPVKFWAVDKTYSSKPDQNKLCKDQRTDDPLLEPNKISGQFVKEKEEGVEDRFGGRIQTSSFEQINGPKNEWDISHPSVKVEQNVPDLQLGLLGQAQNCLNLYPMWGLPARTIKLENSPWERKFYGNCYKYFTRTLEFGIRLKLDPVSKRVVGDWDRDLDDEGTRVLKGHWEKVAGPSGNKVFTGKWIVDDVNGVKANRSNPSHFVRLKDFHDENTKMLLDGNGVPWNPNDFLLQVPSSVSAQLFLGGSLDTTQSYRYVVTARNALGETTASQEAAADPVTGDDPTAYRQIQVAWRPVPGATSYKVYRADGSGAFKLLVSGFTGIYYQDDGSFATSGGPPPETNDAFTGYRTRPGVRHVEKYQEFDFNVFNLPVDL